jgi:hypothetical protein
MGDIVIDHVSTHKLLADIFTKLLDNKRFYELRSELNVLDLGTWIEILQTLIIYYTFDHILFQLVQLQIHISSCAKV